MIKLIATDMDGTFLRDDMSYDRLHFSKLYTEMQRQGVHFVVASGNQYFQLKSFFEDYPDTIYVAENGAYILDEKQVYALHAFSSLAVKQILPKLIEIPELKILVCGQKCAYARASEGEAHIQFVHRYYHQLTVVEDFDHIDDNVLKFAITCPPELTEDIVARLRIMLIGLAEPTSSGHGDIDVIQLGMNKAAGLRELGTVLGIALSEMCAFGDGGNDLEMIREVGLGVSMQNAQPAVTAVAKAKTTDNQSQGVLSFIDQLLEKQF
ncbi:Cof-type HAD-IIB family hydrolase [Sporolactobacillus pectinivorans]|uniref:Cof-type HAD-IIB family hydrolase n=1 Tax=Sporolactobacillus pectinivorans TaxID=1591408 RepID=UPI000C25EAAC|nr:Cof-type HAD-IIB family hydrolase [Sporolactobacillus pectinivorans]